MPGSHQSSWLNRSQWVSQLVSDKHNQWSDSGPIKTLQNHEPQEILGALEEIKSSVSRLESEVQICRAELSQVCFVFDWEFEKKDCWNIFKWRNRYWVRRSWTLSPVFRQGWEEEWSEHQKQTEHKPMDLSEFSRQVVQESLLRWVRTTLRALWNDMMIKCGDTRSPMTSPL